MKQVGIWLDKLEANGVILDNGKESLFNIPSELEFFNPKGGSRSKTRWGPQDVIQDSKYLEREKHQLKNYFEEIAEQISDADQIAIFGPAEAPEKFVESLKDNHPKLASKIKTTKTVDSMTKNQFKALVKQSFGMDDRYPDAT
ncbi:MAG: hypothetical protein H2058_00290 [Muricauda sp.]|uniref:Host attachment protein n=1 Tax=Allomuricauda ruestringensis (strain DSM 13258 / CIP 107369 / LMG 19739 / B1) TaxID=886377 RepID=G2PJ54_ALLRU|nr:MULTISPECIES: hypothetical protein [Allomuricauda]AEM71875.1 hypothetical protein Murru_2851 [Allomuricauda ruestringensis DSM 13258]MBA4743669.1 hypothetical protein [Allomuricauda sp.]